MTCLLLKIAEIGTNKMQERERGETSNDTGVKQISKDFNDLVEFAIKRRYRGQRFIFVDGGF